MLPRSEGVNLQENHDSVKVDWQGSAAVLQQLTRSGRLRAIRWVEEIDSTNRLAKELAEQATCETPLLIVAKKQTAGRGRLGRSWFSDSGTLTFSLALAMKDLCVERERWSQLALVAGLAVCDVLSEIIDSVPVQLKWPNDVYVDGGKVAGVLIETAGSNHETVVIGIGLNVATDLRRAPLEVQQRARSLRDFADHPPDPLLILPELVDRIACRVGQWKADPQEITRDFALVCLLSGRDVTIQSGRREIQGRCLGIDQEGHLQVRGNDNEVAVVRSGEVVSWSRQSKGAHG